MLHAVRRLTGHDVDALLEVMFVGTAQLLDSDAVNVPRVSDGDIVWGLIETLKCHGRRVVERQRRRRVVRYDHVVVVIRASCNTLVVSNNTTTAPVQLLFTVALS